MVLAYMKYYKLIYKNGVKEYAKAKSDLDLIRTMDLATAKHINTTIIRIDDPLEIAMIQMGGTP